MAPCAIQGAPRLLLACYAALAIAKRTAPEGLDSSAAVMAALLPLDEPQGTSLLQYDQSIRVPDKGVQMHSGGLHQNGGSTRVKVASIRSTTGIIFLVLGVFVLISYLPTLLTPDPSGNTTREQRKEKPNAGELSPVSAASTAPSDRESDRQSPPTSTVLFFVLGHVVCASTLTVVNKKAMVGFKPPVEGEYMWSLVVIQFLFAAITARFCGICGLVRCPGLETRKALAFFPAAGMFMITIVAGNMVMNFANVNTFLVLRSLVPIPVALAEIGVYSDPRPPCASWLGMLLTAGGAIGYGSMTAGGFKADGAEIISWAAIYLLIMPVDCILIKHCVGNCRLPPWGLVYYNNILAALPAMVFAFIFEVPDGAAFGNMITALSAPEAKLFVPLSCILGVGLSFFQLNVRYYISATAFVVLGVANKFLTVMWNMVAFEHESPLSVMMVVASLAGAVVWQRTVKGDAVKVREESASWEKNPFLPFAASVVALGLAAYVEHALDKQGKSH